MRVDPAESVELVRVAKQRGTSYQEMSRITGLRDKTLEDLAAGRRKFILHDTARRLSVLADDTVAAPSPGSLVSSRKAQQIRLSLLAQGWSVAHQREILQNNWGIPGGFIIGLETRDTLRLDNHQAYVRLADTIGSREGPSIRTKNWYARRGIFPLRHYDGSGQLIRSTLSLEQKAYL